MGVNFENDLGFSSLETALANVDTDCALVLVDELETGLTTITCNPDQKTSISRRTLS